MMRRCGGRVGQWGLDSQASTAAPFGQRSPKIQTQPVLVTNSRNPRRVAKADRRRKKAAMNVLNHEVAHELEEETPELLA